MRHMGRMGVSERSTKHTDFKVIYGKNEAVTYRKNGSSESESE